MHNLRKQVIKLRPLMLEMQDMLEKEKELPPHAAIALFKKDIADIFSFYKEVAEHVIDIKVKRKLS